MGSKSITYGYAGDVSKILVNGEPTADRVNKRLNKHFCHEVYRVVHVKYPRWTKINIAVKFFAPSGLCSIYGFQIIFKYLYIYTMHLHFLTVV